MPFPSTLRLLLPPLIDLTVRGWAWMAATSAAMTLWLSRGSRTDSQRYKSLSSAGKIAAPQAPQAPRPSAV